MPTDSGADGFASRPTDSVSTDSGAYGPNLKYRACLLVVTKSGDILVESAAAAILAGFERS